MLSLLALEPIYRALIALCFAGFSFPVAGVMVLRLNLIQLRYTLMHGLLLGGAFSLALSLPTLPVYIIMCTLVVLVMLHLGKDGKMNLGVSASFLMVVSVALAAVVTQVADVPGKDTLELLWGSPFTVRWGELAIFIALSLAIVLFTILDRKNIMLIFFDSDVASSSGVNVQAHQSAMVFLIAFAVALSMRYVGALLIDALLILPAVTASKRAVSVRQLFVLSAMLGLAGSLCGFFLSLVLDLPPGSMIALTSALQYILVPRRKH